MNDNKYFFNSFKPKSSCLIASRSQALISVSVCCCGLCYFVVIVCLFSFVFYCETKARDSVATMWKTWLLQNNFSAHVRPERTKYARLQKSGVLFTVLITQFASRQLYAVPCIHAKSEVYFELYRGNHYFKTLKAAPSGKLMNLHFHSDQGEKTNKWAGNMLMFHVDVNMKWLGIRFKNDLFQWFRVDSFFWETITLP